MPRYRKIPVEIDAVQFLGVADVMHGVAILGGDTSPDEEVGWFEAAMEAGDLKVHRGEPGHLAIRTLEGVMRADVGDWIIRGTQGEIYPCKPHIFAEIYEAA